MLPCGTPQVTGTVFDKWPFVLQFWFRAQRYDSNHLRLLESTPYFRSFRIRIVWSMVSKAFFRSMKITPFTRPLSILTDQLLVASINAVSVLCNDRNPNRPFPSSLVPLFQSESKCETILMKMTLICMKKKGFALRLAVSCMTGQKPRAYLLLPLVKPQKTSLRICMRFI